MATMLDDPVRLDQPLLRDGRGQLVPVDWDAAIGDLAERLTDIHAQHGDYAVGHLRRDHARQRRPLLHGQAVARDRLAQPVHERHRRQHRQGPGREVDVGAGGTRAVRRLRPDHPAPRRRREPGRVARRVLVLPRSRPVRPEHRASRRGVGARPAPYRDRAAGDPPPHTTRWHRLRGARPSRTRGAARRRRRRVPRGARPQRRRAACTRRALRPRNHVDHDRSRRRRSRRAGRRRSLSPAPRHHHRHRGHHGGHRERHRVDGVRPADRHRFLRAPGRALVQPRGDLRSRAACCRQLRFRSRVADEPADRTVRRTSSRAR